MKRQTLTLLSAALVATAASSAHAQNAYVVGVTAAMTGPAAGTYAPVMDALRAYIDHVNGKGGVNGRPIQLIIADDQGEPSRAAANAKKLLNQDRVVLLINSSLSSTYAPVVADSKRAGVPLLFAGSACPKETYPPADPLQFCSTAFGATFDSRAALDFIKSQAKEPVRLGLAAMAIPLSRGEIDFAEGLSRQVGMTPVDKQITPPPTPDYTPFATKLKDANPNWVWAWSPWISQVRTFEAMRRLGWNGQYVAWAHLNAEEDLARIKDPGLFVIGSNAFFSDDLPIHAEIRAVTHRANLKHPVSFLAEGFVAGLVIETAMKGAAQPTAQAVTASMNNLKVDLKGLRGGPLEWTKDNHFRTRQYYRVWRWDNSAGAVRRVQDWVAVDVKQ
ncbi:MAG: ABC transporter substrate-binding protein [Betaproteobacteria bacterium]|nr:ABC transporter substrate-binding protein [Betaproteobacteria bacterium]